ncbi:MAG: hypothetical protein V4850_33490 [Myxococcota bacterium]
MLIRRVTLLALLLLTACDEVELEPRPPAGPVLAEGRYDLLVRDVVAVECGEDPGVLRGQVLPAELLIGADGVSFSFAGWMLHGVMEPGNLHVEGYVEAGEPEPVEVEEEDEIDEGDSDEGDTDSVEAGGEDDGREAVEHEGRPEEDPRPELRASALIDATILGMELAEGSLFVSMPDCEVELSVVIGRGGPGHPDEPSEPPHDVEESDERDESDERPDAGSEG